MVYYPKPFRIPPVIGDTYDRWTVIRDAPGASVWVYIECRCACGTERAVRHQLLFSGRSRSCGCRRKRFHGEKSKLYQVWKSMRGRCYKPTNRAYPDYGGRGITVCDEWLQNYQAFREWALANGYREGLTIDRIDNSDGGIYSPSNCRFTTHRENNRNRRSNIRVTAFGETKIAIEWSEDVRCVVGYPTLLDRLHRGWVPERAITEQP